MILLTGGSGQVGCALLASEKAQSLPIIAPSRAALDLSDPESIAAFLAHHPWSAIINAGAYTAVDQAEQQVDEASAVNAQAPALLARYCRDHAIPLIHISTDYVFSGDKASPYLENDATAPLGVYGQTKYAGEQGVLATHCRAVILRAAWIVSPYGKNFIKTMLRLAGDRDEIRVVEDQTGCPTSAADLADVILSILERMRQDPASPQGVYHCTNQGETTWAELADYALQASARLGGATATIIPIPTSEYPTPAKRPHNSRLSSQRLAQDWGIHMRPWRDAVDEIVASLTGKQGIGS